MDDKNNKDDKDEYLDEFRSTNCRLDRPTAVIIPNITQNIPPTIGVGIVRKKAPIIFMSLKDYLIKPFRKNKMHKNKKNRYSLG